FQYNDRRKRHCGCRKRSHQRRSSQQHRSGQSRNSTTVYRTNHGDHKVSNPTNIPFLDLVTPHVELEAELTTVFQKALRSAGFIGGPMVEDFEKAFADFCAAKHSVAVNSGTDALRFALIAAGIK